MTADNRRYALRGEPLDWGGVTVQRFVVPDGASSNKLLSDNKQPGSRIRIVRQQTVPPSIEEFTAGVKKSMADIKPPVKKESPSLVRRIVTGFQGRQPSKA